MFCKKLICQDPNKRCLLKVTYVTFVKHQLKIIQQSSSLRVNFLLTLILQRLTSLNSLTSKLCVSRKKPCGCYSSCFSFFPSHHFFWKDCQNFLANVFRVVIKKACDQDLTHSLGISRNISVNIVPQDVICDVCGT